MLAITRRDVALPLILLLAVAGCEGVKPVTQFKLSQSWFDEQSVAGAGLQMPQTRNLGGKKVFLRVQTTIPDDEKIVRRLKYDDKTKSFVLDQGISIDGGIAKAVEDRIRLRLQKELGVVFAGSPDGVDIRLDVNVSRAGCDPLTTKADVDATQAFQSSGLWSTGFIVFLSVDTKVNEANFPYYGTADCKTRGEIGGSASFPQVARSSTITGESFIGERKLCAFASSYRYQLTYVVVTNIPKEEGTSKVAVFSPTGQPTEMSIGVSQMKQLDLASTASAGDIQNLGERLTKVKDQRAAKYAPYSHMYTTAAGLLTIIMHDYVNQLESAVMKEVP
jgi:hypothetical protein